MNEKGETSDVKCDTYGKFTINRWQKADIPVLTLTMLLQYPEFFYKINLKLSLQIPVFTGTGLIGQSRMFAEFRIATAPGAGRSSRGMTDSMRSINDKKA
jgi:hypothetical protein